MRVRRPLRGFTLIELMITVAIIAILAAIAYPSYQESVARGRRAEAKSVLLEAAQWAERQYTINNDYSLNALPDQHKEAPRDSSAKTYSISFAASSATTFTIQAVPKNAMTGDKCGTLTLKNTGEKSAAIASCWDK